MTCGWTGVCRLVFRSYSLLITNSCCHIHFYDKPWRKMTHFWLFFANFWIAHSCLRKICRKRDPLFREFRTQKPTHMGGTYPYPQQVMLPPPPRKERGEKDNYGENGGKGRQRTGRDREREKGGSRGAQFKFVKVSSRQDLDACCIQNLQTYRFNRIFHSSTVR